MIRDGDIYFYLNDEVHGWMSNFYPASFALEGRRWKTNEHYYQAMKSAKEDFRNWIRDAPNPYHAMRAGRALRQEKGEIRPGWDGMRARVMLDGLRAKFKQNPDLRDKLLDTGTIFIHEDSPTDMYWGVKGEDMLGRLLMRVRAELRYGDEDG